MSIRKMIFHNLIITFFYTFLGYLVFVFFSQFGIFPAPNWPPSSVALIAMLINWKAYFPAVFAGALIVNLVFFSAVSHIDTIPTIVICVGDTVAPLVAAIMIRRRVSQMPPFNKLRDVVVFLFYGVLVQGLISTSAGLISLLISGNITFNILKILETGINWWLAEAGGVLFFAPAIAFWVFKGKRLFDKKMYREGIVVATLTLLLAVFIFSRKEITQEIPYLLLFPFMWLTVRLSAKGALTALALVSVIGAVGTMYNLGPFSLLNTDTPLQSLGLMVMAVSVTVLSIGALNHEGRVMAGELRQANEFLEQRVEKRTAELNDELHFEQLLIETLPIPFYYQDSKGLIIKCNEAFAQLSAKGKKDILNKDFAQIGIKLQLEKNNTEENNEDNGEVQNEAKLILPTGQERSIINSSTHFSSINNADKSGIIATMTDVTELKTLQKMFEQQAITDVLTGILNRRGFMDRAKEELSRVRRLGGQLGVVMLDIDKFKNINDKYGHDIGDIVLKGLKSVFQKNLREFDVCGRLGGEEFAIILLGIPSTDKSANESTMLAIAERIRGYVEDMVVSLPDGKELKYTISLGVTMANEIDSSIEEVLQRADKNLYQAKNTGRNKVVFI